MVSRNHDRLDSRLAAHRYRVFRLMPGRVNHSYQPHQPQTVFQLLRRGALRDLVDFLIRDRQHSQRVGAHAVVYYFCLLNVPAVAAAGQHIKRAFDNDYVFPIHAVDCGHQLAVRIERDFRQSGIVLVQLILGHAVLISREHNRRFGGVADMLLLPVLYHHRAVAA